MHSLNYFASNLQYKLRELNTYDVGTVMIFAPKQATLSFLSMVKVG